MRKILFNRKWNGRVDMPWGQSKYSKKKKNKKRISFVTTGSRLISRIWFFGICQRNVRIDKRQSDLHISLVHLNCEYYCRLLLRTLHTLCSPLSTTKLSGKVRTHRTMPIYIYMQAGLGVAHNRETVSQVTSQPQHAFHFSASFSLSPIQFQPRRRRRCNFFFFYFLISTFWLFWQSIQACSF